MGAILQSWVSLIQVAGLMQCESPGLHFCESFKFYDSNAANLSHLVQGRDSYESRLWRFRERFRGYGSCPLTVKVGRKG